ncbi:hypothetical protein KEJ39_05565, partial [Candidatus Bathyarchaeota archaeon]|nr:hypothetical protein [Candidatus Bathyarchaeota archaeon]
GGSPLKSHCVNAEVTVTVSTAPYFTLSIEPSGRTVHPDGSTTFTVTVGSVNGFHQQVQLAVTGNPAGTTATLSPTEVTPPENGEITSTLTVSTSSTPLFGTFTITVTGASSGFTQQSASATLTVSPLVEPDFAVYVLPTTLSVVRNESGTATIQVVSINNFDESVDLTLLNLPTGVTYSITNPTVAPLPGGYVNTKLTVQTSSSADLGEYAMTLRGTSGSKVHSVNLVLAVINRTVTPIPLRCIIATATYGSEFTPEVQFLRGFRDKRVLATTAGSAFMEVFNAWYYSFSPQIAGWLAVNPAAREVTKILLAPLLAILHLAEISYGALAFSPEAAVTLAGLVASSLIGVVYFGPALAITLRGYTGPTWKKMIRLIAVAWGFSLLLLVSGLAACLLLAVKVAVSILVLATLSSGACLLSIAASRMRLLLRRSI